MSEGNLTVADEFVLSQDANVKEINWWGENMSSPSKNFIIRVFADNEGQPGTLLLEATHASILKRKTGDFLIRKEGRGDHNLYPEYQYTLVLPHPFTLEAGVKYWLSVLSESTSQWTWEMSQSEENTGVQRSLFADPVNGPWTPFDYNAAFVIGPVPKPRSVRLIKH